MSREDSPVSYKEKASWPDCLHEEGAATVQYQAAMPLLDCYRVVLYDLLNQSASKEDPQLAELARRLMDTTGIAIETQDGEQEQA